MRNYVMLAAISVVCFLLAVSALTVAVGLLGVETYKTFVAAYSVSIDVIEYTKEFWQFVSYSGGI